MEKKEEEKKQTQSSYLLCMKHTETHTQMIIRQCDLKDNI